MSLKPGTEAQEEALIPLSALQHFLFCPRQCALIHVERLWAEDSATAEGRALHQRADTGPPERRQGVKILRSLTLRSFSLGVAGKADVVEMHGGQPYPVEYKRGRPKAHRADEVQLCAQAICLEEMFDCAVPQGALFYGATRRRIEVAFDNTLRALTQEIARQTRALLASGQTPPPVYKPSCANCSLHDLCAPEALQTPPRITAWLVRQIGR
ncbi:CRISPR-associated protein Cas4 [Acidiphilium sp. AL]|uniref:CRISPR-associated exonuclease Cas4 n=1 Tax=Acidiphilium iwatense TaxID=768198 RepID=A0ABS9DY48_9PROT|nr:MULTISPECIES: CRISPR-associated protein Cas4 [Acidiphilium]MCF3947105.1 CRISPR-associated protein Cas4 [Acidiphilium iwatense]MCU4160588.1 CRISPR-associated protein Cas4 [Acidiphilium sp. AL]